MDGLLEIINYILDLGSMLLESFMFSPYVVLCLPFFIGIISFLIYEVYKLIKRSVYR